jgi:uncharacterized protein YcaQ
MGKVPTLDDLRRYAVARTLFAPTTLQRAIDRLGFVQADPIRAPARSQDLTLRHRVAGYRAGDLERRYPSLNVEEDFFVNYGFLPRETQALMHPRKPRSRWSPTRTAKAEALLAFVAERGAAHPREVDAHFQHGRVRNWFGGSSNASTQLLDEMHYRGMLRIARREGGVRVYAAREAHAPPESGAAAMDSLADVIVRKYAPLPERSLAGLLYFLRRGAPQWERDRHTALIRARERLPSAEAEGVRWLWPTGESPGSARWAAQPQSDAVRLLAPFDPIVWDRRRFEMMWGWEYRFEAYTPAAKRVRGYYALPLLWRDRVIGWGNLSVVDGSLRADLGYVSGKAPREAAFRRGLEAELESMRVFLGLELG